MTKIKYTTGFGVFLIVLGLAKLLVGLNWTHQAAIDEEEGNPGHKTLNRNGWIMIVLGIIVGFSGLLTGPTFQSYTEMGEKCDHCGTEGLKDSKYCGECGKPLPPAKPVVKDGE